MFLQSLQESRLFYFEVDVEKWRQMKVNKQYARPQSEVKREALRAFTKAALTDDIISPSSASEWCQVHLTPKKTPGDWRITNDFRPLNQCIIRRAWPIPNIKSILFQLGRKKPKIFAVLDMTSGFHQMAVAIVCQHFLTFATEDGHYKWLRAPMGVADVPV